MTPEEHQSVKVASHKLGMTMKDFILSTTFKKVEELEEYDRFKRHQIIDDFWEEIENSDYY
jgi:hypothetical protein